MVLREKSKVGLAEAMAPAVIIIGFILLGFTGENGVWGLNHLFFYSGAVKLIIALLAVGVLFPQSAGLYLAGVARLENLKPLVKQIILAVIAVALFVILKVTVHSLGDGYQRAFEIENGRIYSPTEMLDYAIHAMVYRLLLLLVNIKAATAMAITSIAMGALFALMIVRLAPFTGEKKSVFLLLIFSLGSSQLFFGYVESYTLLYFAAVWYLLLIFQPPGREASFSQVTAAYLLAGLAHQAGVILLPSYLLVAHFQFREHRQRFLILPGILLLSFLPTLIPWGINQLLIIEPGRKLADYFLSLSGAPYCLFSPLHLIDILNQFLLVAPIIFMFVPFWRYKPWLKSRALMTMALIGPALLFILVIDPVLTLARDWDLFAVPVVIAIFPLLMLLLKALPADKTIMRRVAAAGLAAAVLSGAWIGINHSVDKHLSRSEYILDHSVKGKRYGYELLAYYFSSHTDYANELRMLQKIPQAEWTARIYAKISQSLYSQGHFEEAYNLAQKGVLLPNPTDLNALMAGITSYDRNEYPKAIHYLRIAGDHWPEDPQVWCKLADALREGDSLAAAAQIYEQVISLDNRLARPFFGLAFVSCRLKDYDRAQNYYREGLKRDPSYPTASLIENMIKDRK